MICAECYMMLEKGDRYKIYLYNGLEGYVHVIGCEGALLDRIKEVKLKRFNDEMDAIEKQFLNETPEEVDKYLRDAGYDPDALAARMQKRIRKMLDESPLNPKNRKDDHQS